MLFNIFGKKVHLKKEPFAILIILSIMILGATGFILSRGEGSIVIDATIPEVSEKGKSSSDSQKDTKEMDEVEEIKVHVVGCVKNPGGIVTLKKGQLIDDAIKAAGGATPDADLDNINLVYQLNENVKLEVRSKNAVNPSEKETPTSSNSSSEAGQGIGIVRDSGGAVTGSNSSNTKSNSKVNINTAAISELTTLPYIGEATAKEIISYREKNGKFKKITDIMNVPGIKEGRFNSIKDLITVG